MAVLGCFMGCFFMDFGALFGQSIGHLLLVSWALSVSVCRRGHGLKLERQDAVAVGRKERYSAQTNRNLGAWKGVSSGLED